MSNFWDNFVEFCKDKYKLWEFGETSLTFSIIKDGFEQLFHIYRKNEPNEIRIYAMFEKNQILRSREIVKEFNKNAEIVTFQPTNENAIQFIISINEKTDLKFIESQINGIYDLATTIRKNSSN